MSSGLPEGTICPATMPYWKSPFEFYVSLINTQADYVTVMKSMQDHYRNDIVPQQTLPATFGTFVVCRKNNIFYRAQVVRGGDGSAAAAAPHEIRFIDTGDHAAMPLPTEMWPLDARFAQLPPQAIRCCLPDVIQMADNQQIVRSLQRHVDGKTKLSVKLLGKQQLTSTTATGGTAESNGLGDWTTETMWVDLRVGEKSIRDMLIAAALLTPIPDGNGIPINSQSIYPIIQTFC